MFRAINSSLTKLNTHDVGDISPKFEATLWLFVGAVFFVRVLVLFLFKMPLGVDEIQYAVWSKHLAWGYHSKPPMIAWTIALSTYLAHGFPLVQVRLFSPVCYLITSIFLYLTTDRLFDRKTALWVLLSFTSLLAVGFGSLLMTTDALLLMFWSIGLYLLSRIMLRPRMFDWLLLGVAIGLGALSKYTAMVFWLALILFVWVQKDQRHLLKSFGLYLAVALSFAILAPNIMWNANHHFASFGHVLHHNIDLSGPSIHLKGFFNFLFSQFGVFSPIFFPLLIWLLAAKPYKNQDWKFNFLRCFSLVMLFAVCFEALFSRAYANWAIVAYAAGTILVVQQLLAYKQQLWLKINTYAMLAIIGVVYIFILAVGIDHLPHKMVPKTLRRSLVWQQFASDVDMLHQLYPDAKFVFDNRKYWASSVYYSGIPVTDVLAYDGSADFQPDALGTFLKYHIDDALQLTQQSSLGNTKKLSEYHFWNGKLWQKSFYRWPNAPDHFVIEYHELHHNPVYFRRGYDIYKSDLYFLFYYDYTRHLSFNLPMSSAGIQQARNPNQRYIYVMDRSYPDLALPLAFKVQSLDSMLPHLPNSDQVVNVLLLSPKGT